MLRKNLCVLMSLWVPALIAQAEPQWLDLTHALSADAVFWPTAAPFEMSTDFEGDTDKGYYYSAYSFTTAEHGGTHIDAPVHFARGQRTVDEIPLEQLIGDAVVVDVRGPVARSPDYQIQQADFERWEARHGKIPADTIVLLYTGFGRHWPDAGRYLGTELRGEAGVAALSFPGLSEPAAQWLMAQREVKAVGIDTASIDYGKSTDFATHVTLMRQNIPVFENVANLERLPPTGAFVVALPAKIRGGSGGPLRIVARVNSAD